MFNKNSININIPISISYLWNFGSLLGFFIILQITRGLLLILNYINFSSLTFDYCIELFFDYNSGWLLHNLHANGASALFFFFFLHIWRGIYYTSYYKKFLWWRGLFLLLLNIITAFLGYVLPWGQISYWGTTVITGLVTVLPYVGYDVLSYIWGDKIVRSQTLSRFIVLHFLFPFVLIIIIIVHTTFLHSYGSNNVFGLHNKIWTTKFNPLYRVKDILLVIVYMLRFNVVILGIPTILIEVVNRLEANPIITPTHIQPEWYFLFAYAILRSIPNKIGGVFALVISIFIFFFFSFRRNYIRRKYKIIHKLIFYIFITVFISLTILGACPVEAPFIFIRKLITCLYFIITLLFIL